MGKHRHSNEPLKRAPSKRALLVVAEEVRYRLVPDCAEEGSCDVVADAVTAALKRRGYDAFTVYGAWRGHPHAWTRVGDYYVDATRDQFRHYAVSEAEEAWLGDEPVVAVAARRGDYVA